MGRARTCDTKGFALPTFAQQTTPPINNYANGLSRSFKNIAMQ